MAEPDLFNSTPFRAEALPYLAADGAECRLLVLKASYGIQRDGRVLPLRRQRPIRAADEPWGPPEVPDVRFPGDLCEHRPGTDVIVVGHARTPRAAPLREHAVSIAVADRRRELRITGPRVFERHLLGVRPSAAEPFAALPLAWSHAWGGSDASGDELLEEKRNPAGRGTAHRSRDLIGQPAPQIEDADGRDERTPAGCAALGPSYEPRRSLAGTYDAAWLASRHPAKPSDYDPRHENRAAPGLIFERPLRGGERVQIAGMRHDGALDFALPRVYPVLEGVIEGAAQTQRPHLDSVLVDVDARVLELCWRAAFPWPGPGGRFEELHVEERELR